MERKLTAAMPRTQSGFFLGERLGEDQLVIALVGLPARGKSYISAKIARYLNWLGIKAKVFNAGDTRRELIGAGQPAEFFDPNNEKGMKAREEVASITLQRLFHFLEEDDGVVGIFDATNSTIGRRKWVTEECSKQGVKVLFLESICDKKEILDRNVLATKTSGNPDYRQVHDEAQILEDFSKRVHLYESVYQSVQSSEGTPIIQIINQGEEMRLFKIDGWVPSRLTFFLMNLHIGPRRIWLCRHGESQFNAEGRLGGDPGLTARGTKFAHKLDEYITNQLREMYDGDEQKILENQPRIWASTLKRSKMTARLLSQKFKMVQWKCLDEINAGACDSMTPEEIKQKMPDVSSEREKDKFQYRYPGNGGESYFDLINRVEPALIELERSHDHLVIVVHNAIVRVLFAYFQDLDPKSVVFNDIPLHRVYCFDPLPHGKFRMTYHDIDVDKA
eukprot:ANDGO_00685.mRNA.1 6-phosphofructo-2-kinase/fructose-2